ncbi:MAG TPA: nucleoside triphosphate pyrophosphohydrolase [Acidobacteriota bacterium]|nr:nucleoside triphosphate pyrophosphohydrolase [Acidobacteriota bacterium]
MIEKWKHNPHTKEIAERFGKLVDVMFTLRSEGGCPWDRAQTLHDLKQYLLEEAYELLQTLDHEDATAMCEELGDLMFQIVFQSQMMQERAAFSLVEVLDHLLAKMISRHPHVFGDVEAETPQKALASWESMKMSESSRKSEGGRRTLLEGVPLNLPALLQANLISSKVARVGFDWESEADVWKKFEEELNEFRHAESEKAREEEMGDILFTLVNIARKNGINPEDALRNANIKFRSRFNRLEQKAREQDRELSGMTLAEMDRLWEEVKKEEGR